MVQLDHIDHVFNHHFISGFVLIFLWVIDMSKMIKLTERVVVDRAIESFAHCIDNPAWGTAKWPKERQHRMLKESQSLVNPTAKDISEIWGSDYYTRQPECSCCRDTSWEMIEVTTDDEDEYGRKNKCIICKTCMQKALDLI